MPEIAPLRFLTAGHLRKLIFIGLTIVALTLPLPGATSPAAAADPAGDRSGLIRVKTSLPKSHRARADLAVNLIVAGQPERGRQIAQRALARTDLTPAERAGYLFVMAAYYHKRPNVAEALRYYRLAAKENTPIAPIALSTRASYLTSMGRYQEALADARRCLKMTGNRATPKNARCYLSMANTFLVTRRYAATERAAKAALGAGMVKWGMAWDMLGMAQLAQRKFRAAERSFSRALLINPYDRVARVGLKNAINRRLPRGTMPAH